MDSVISWIILFGMVVFMFVIFVKAVNTEQEYRHEISEKEWKNLISDYKEQDFYDEFYG